MNRPNVTAGLMWHPEMCPMVYAMASSDSPKARDTPTNPTLSPDSTAQPHPPKTRTNVPTNSARYLDMLVVLQTHITLADTSGKASDVHFECEIAEQTCSRSMLGSFYVCIGHHSIQSCVVD